MTMTDVPHTQHEPNPQDPQYQAGHQAATVQHRDNLAEVLQGFRSPAVQGDTETPLTDSQVRQIFAFVFGTAALDEVFGPEPTGRFDEPRGWDDYRPEDL